MSRTALTFLGSRHRRIPEFRSTKRPTAARSLLLLVLVLVALVGCRKPAPSAAPAEAPEPETRLHFAARTELFAEIPPLVAGRPSRLAIHFTRLADWRPVAAGRVVVELGADRVTVDAPSSPGIFGATATPATAGTRTLAITLDLDGTPERHELGSIRVYASEAEAHADAHAEKPGAIKLLMEQQWRTEFAVTEAIEKPMRSSLMLFGTVRGRPEGDTTVRAPLAGQIVKAGTAFPRIGDAVKAGQVLAILQPRFDATIDVGQLARDRARAEATLAYAKKERERQEQLLKDGLANTRDVDLARRDELIALGEVAAAQRVMSISTGGPAAAAGLPITAPFDGSVVAVETSSASIAERGGPLFRIADLGRLWLELRVPEADRARVATPFGATISVGLAGELASGAKATDIEVPATGFVTLGAAVDPATRTVPLIFEVPGEATLGLGSSVRARVYTAAPKLTVAVPASALVDDQGQSVVYVQLDGESFERRVVVTGARDGAFVAVTSGLSLGQHVVTTGAYAVKLAASSGAVPAHGHVH